MTEPPRFGRLERLRGNGRWVTTKRFYTRQLEKGKLRYVHTKGNPATDSFRFVVSVQGIVAAGDVAEDGPSGAVSANDHLAKDTFNINIISNTIRPKRQVSGVIVLRRVLLGRKGNAAWSLNVVKLGSGCGSTGRAVTSDNFSH